MQTLSCNIDCNNTILGISTFEVDDLNRFTDTELLSLFKLNSFLIKTLVYKQFQARYSEPKKNTKQWEAIKTSLMYCEFTLIEPYGDVQGNSGN